MRSGARPTSVAVAPASAVLADRIAAAFPVRSAVAAGAAASGGSGIAAPPASPANPPAPDPTPGTKPADRGAVSIPTSAASLPRLGDDVVAQRWMDDFSDLLADAEVPGGNGAASPAPAAIAAVAAIATSPAAATASAPDTGRADKPSPDEPKSRGERSPAADAIVAIADVADRSPGSPFDLRPRRAEGFTIANVPAVDGVGPSGPVVRSNWGWRRVGIVALKAAATLILVWFAAVAAAIVMFRFVDPPGSMLMLSHRLAGEPVEQRWVDVGAVSNEVVRAVITSEDGRFCSHWGIDLREIANAIARSRNGVPRGASTITMQVAKNMFLWPSKSYVRKALEVPVTLGIEAVWPKRRILEVYLNIAEWGPGVFGIESAARHHFGKSAARLNRTEAALLAVSLPNPIDRRAGRPGPGTRRLARLIEARVRAGAAATSCIAAAK